MTEHKSQASSREDVARRWTTKLQSSFVQRDDYLVAAVRGKSVLHLGCSDAPFTQDKTEAGTLLHYRVAAAANYCLGVDLDRQALDLMQMHCAPNDLLHADVEDERFAAEASKQDWDVILAADLIEHVGNPARMLEQCFKVMNPETQLIISTINAYGLKLALRAMARREAVHPDHVSYYSYATLSHLLERFDLKANAAFQTFAYPFRSGALTQVQPWFYRAFSALGDGIIVTATKT